MDQLVDGISAVAGTSVPNLSPVPPDPDCPPLTTSPYFR